MNNRYKIIVIGGSAGSFNTVLRILESISPPFKLPLVMCLHRLKDIRNGFVESLNTVSNLEVIEPLDKTPVKDGIVYLSPANYHLLVEEGKTFALSTGKEENFSRPSLDLTFKSAGSAYKNEMVGILLSGANGDGAKGMLYCKYKNAYTIIQDPGEALFDTMPLKALEHFTPEKIMKSEEIIDFINQLNDQIIN